MEITMPGRINFEFSLGKPSGAATARRDDHPMRLALLGDFGGTGTRTSLGVRPMHRIDVDNLDTVLRRVAPQLMLDVAGRQCRFAVESLRDFHPDRLLATIPPLAATLAMRDR